MSRNGFWRTLAAREDLWLLVFIIGVVITGIVSAVTGHSL